MTVHLGEMTWREAEELVRKEAIVVVPVGAFEQHGHHLPLDTDQRLVTKVTEGAVGKAQENQVPCVMTSTIWTGFSPHHMQFPGSVTLSLETLQHVLEEVCLGLWQHGFRKIFIVNGHGGNMAVIKGVTQNLMFKHGVRTVNASYWDFVISYMKEWRKSEPGGIDHACEMETALMLHLNEELVDQNELQEQNWFPKSKYLSGDLTIGGVVGTAFDFKEITEYGVAGDPSAASKDSGKQLYEKITGEISEFLKEFKRWDWDQIDNI